MGKLQQPVTLHSFTHRQCLLIHFKFNPNFSSVRWVTTTEDFYRQTRDTPITRGRNGRKLDAQKNCRRVTYNNPSSTSSSTPFVSSMGSLGLVSKSLPVNNKSSCRSTGINLDTVKDKKTEPLLTISDLRQRISQAIIRFNHFSDCNPVTKTRPVQIQDTTTLEEALYYINIFDVILCRHHEKEVQQELKKHKSDLSSGVSMTSLGTATRTLADSGSRWPFGVKEWKEHSLSTTDSMSVSSPYEATDKDWQLIQTHALLLEWVTLAASRASRREFMLRRNAISEALLSNCVYLEHNVWHNRLTELSIEWDAAITATATASQNQDNVQMISLWRFSVHRFKLLHRQLAQQGAQAYLQMLVLHDSAPRDKEEWRQLCELLLPLPPPSISQQSGNHMLIGDNNAGVTDNGNSFHKRREPLGAIGRNPAKMDTSKGTSTQQRVAYHIAQIPLLPSGLRSPIHLSRPNPHTETYTTMMEGSVRYVSDDHKNLKLLSIKLSWKEAYALLCWGWTFSCTDNQECSTEWPMVEKNDATSSPNDTYRSVHLSSLDVLHVLTKYAQEAGLREDSIRDESESYNDSTMTFEREKEDDISDDNDSTETLRGTLSQIFTHAKRRGQDARVVSSLIAQWEQSRSIERVHATIVASCGIDYTIYDRISIHGKKVVTWKGDHETIPEHHASASAKIHQNIPKVTSALRSDRPCVSHCKDLNELILNQMWEAVVGHVIEAAHHALTKSTIEKCEHNVGTKTRTGDFSVWCDQHWLVLDEFFGNSLQGASMRALYAHPSRMLRMSLPSHLINTPMTDAEQRLLQHPSSINLFMKTYCRLRRRMHSIRWKDIKGGSAKTIRCEKEKTALNFLERATQGDLCNNLRSSVPPSFTVGLRRRLWVLRQLPYHIPRSLVVFAHQGRGLVPLIERIPQKELLPWFLVSVIGLATRLSLSHTTSEKYNTSTDFSTMPWVKLLRRARQCVAPTLWGQPLPNYAAFADFCSMALIELGSQASATALRVDLIGGFVNGDPFTASAERFMMRNTGNADPGWRKAPFTLSTAVEVLLRPPSAAALQMLLLAPSHHQRANRTSDVFCTASSSNHNPGSNASSENLKWLANAVMQSHTAWEQWKRATPNEDVNLESHPMAAAVSQIWTEVDDDELGSWQKMGLLYVLPAEVQQLVKKNFALASISCELGTVDKQVREIINENNPNGVPPGYHCINSRAFSFLIKQLASLRNYHVSLYLETLALTDATLVQLLDIVGTHLSNDGPAVLAPEAAAALTSAFLMHLLPLSVRQGKDKDTNSDHTSLWATALVEAFGGGFFFVVPADRAYAVQSYFKALYHPSFLLEVRTAIQEDRINPEKRTDIVEEPLHGAAALLACRSLRIMSKYPTSATEAWFPSPDQILRNCDDSTIPRSLRLRVMYVDIIRAVQYFMAKSNHPAALSSPPTRAVDQRYDELHPTGKSSREKGGEVDVVSLISAPGMLQYGLCAVSKPSGMSTTLHAAFPSLVSPHLMALLPWQGGIKMPHTKASEIRTPRPQFEVPVEIKPTPAWFTEVSVNEAAVHHQHGLINRIDVGTSGVVLLTRDTASLHYSCYATGTQRRSRKFYRALIQSVLPDLDEVEIIRQKNAASRSRVVKSHGYGFLPSRGIITGAVYTNASCRKERQRTPRFTPNDEEGTFLDNNESGDYTGNITSNSRNTHSLWYFNNLVRNSVPDDRRSAITRYRVLERFPTFGVSYVEAEIITGRRHQVRQHFAQIHHPLLGDDRFHPAYIRKETHVNESFLRSKTKGATDLLRIIPRLALHAHIVDIIGNEAGSRAVVECVLPADMQHALAWLRCRS
ncbi:unnamed protein product [Phytomonas sp. Hart1]|nr:unnamed protein product [Phytomonas sp. Hart1]|eukprot:CCW66632.1 unnamed protein product [Phytomonas sp. isolate Hart1]